MKAHSIGFGRKNEEGKIEDIGEVTVNLPENLDEATRVWGEAVVLSKCLSSVIIDAQRIARSADTVEAAQEALSKWVPGISRVSEGGTSMAAIQKKLRDMKKENPDKLKELLALLGD